MGSVADLSAVATVERIIVRVHAAPSATGQGVSTIGPTVTAVSVGLQAIRHGDTLALAAATAFDITRVAAAATMWFLTLDPATRAVEAPSGECGGTVAALPAGTSWVLWRTTNRAAAEAAVFRVALEIDADAAAQFGSRCATAIGDADATDARLVRAAPLLRGALATAAVVIAADLPGAVLRTRLLLCPALLLPAFPGLRIVPADESGERGREPGEGSRLQQPHNRAAGSERGQGLGQVIEAAIIHRGTPP